MHTLTTAYVYYDVTPEEEEAIDVPYYKQLSEDGKSVIGTDVAYEPLAAKSVAPYVQPAVEKTREQKKAERAERVASILVTTQAGHVFNGDETSQNRMSRAITALRAAGQTSTLWVLANNEAINVSVDELAEALILAGQAQTAIWYVN
jgi:type V secretory pathway adhesin AidA